jgi:hypothetical protein
MEDVWKKFKEETKGDMEKINDFLKDPSLFKPDGAEPNSFQPRPLEKMEREISENIVIEDDEKSQSSISSVSSKKFYGSLSNVVKEMMEKEKISRAQAYRRAKKLAAEKSQ